MKHYIQINIKKLKTIKPPVVINELMDNLHFQLSTLSMSSVGVSFPEYDDTLGTVMRIHGTKEDLVALGTQWLGKACASVTVTEILDVPDDVEYFTFSRVREQYSMSKLRNFAKKKGFSEERFKKEKKKVMSSFIDLPFISIKSNSNSQHYKRFIAKRKVEAGSVDGFDSFGLSKKSPVPVFE